MGPIAEAKDVVIGTTTAAIDGSAKPAVLSNARQATSSPKPCRTEWPSRKTTAPSRRRRSACLGGEITFGDVITVLPFSNMFATVDISGADAVEACDRRQRGGERIRSLPAGCRLGYGTLANPPDERVGNAMVGSGDSFDPIDEAAT